MISLITAAKTGDFDAVKALIDPGNVSQLRRVFAVAATDFSTVKRRASHQQILKLCLDLGVNASDPVGWMDVPAICWAAMYGNREIVAYFGPQDASNPLSTNQDLSRLAERFCMDARIGEQLAQ